MGQPAFATLAGGMKVATIVKGPGPQIQPGQTANVLYTGYLSKTGQIFDDSASHGGAPLGFTLCAGTRPRLRRGDRRHEGRRDADHLDPAGPGVRLPANGAIPANSTLVFVLTLE